MNISKDNERHYRVMVSGFSAVPALSEVHDAPYLVSAIRANRRCKQLT